MTYILELFNKYSPPDEHEFGTEEAARKILKSELQKNPERGWKLSRIEVLDGSDIRGGV